MEAVMSDKKYVVTIARQFGVPWTSNSQAYE